MQKVFDTVEEFWGFEDVKRAYKRAGGNSLAAFRAELGRYLGVPGARIHLAPSGHQALEWLLQSKRDPRPIVLAPAFNCSVVRMAIEAAGYELRTYDFSPRPGLFDWQEVSRKITESVAAVVVTHYYGVPVDFRPIVEICANKSIAVIEDCAHALGGTIDGQQVGTIGDAALFSFNYDKPISLGWGGAAVVQNGGMFERGLAAPFQTPSTDAEYEMLMKFMDVMAERRRIIPFQASFWKKVWNRANRRANRKFVKDSIISIGPLQAELGRWCLSKYPTVLKVRTGCARKVASRVVQETWPVDNHVEPGWLKQRLRLKDKRTVKRVGKELQRQGYRVGNFNWPILIERGHQEQVKHSLEAATIWVDVPIHQNLDNASCDHLIDLLNEYGG